MGSSVPFILVAAAALCLCANAHSWIACTDYRGDMNYYQDSECMSYPRGWNTRCGRYPGCEDKDGKGFFIARGDFSHEICFPGQNSGKVDRVNGMCQDHDIIDHSKGGSFGGGTTKRSTPAPRYTEAHPAAIYEEGGRYCLAWPMKNHANAACKRNGGGDDSRLYFHPVDSNDFNERHKDPSFDDFMKFNIRGPACSNLGFMQDSQRVAGSQCQMTAEETGSNSDDFRCNGYTRSPRYCEDTDGAMGTGCFTLPPQAKPGKYTFMWYWSLGRGTTDRCSSKYSTCWEVEIVPKASSKAHKSPSPGTKGTPKPAGTASERGESQACTNDFSSNPEPAKPPPPTPPPTPPTWGGGGGWNPSPPPGCPNGVCTNTGTCNPSKDHSICSSRLSSGWYTCASTSELTMCNGVSYRHKILCGYQKLTTYCPQSCGGCTAACDGVEGSSSCTSSSSSSGGSSEGSSSGFATGDRVVIKGLRSRPDLNGMKGTLKNYVSSSSRWNVDLDNGQKYAFTEKNLEKASSGSGRSSGWVQAATSVHAQSVASSKQAESASAKCRNVNQQKCISFSKKGSFFADCNGDTQYQFDEGPMTLLEYCGCQCDRVTLIEQGMLPDSLIHTDLNEKNEPVQMVVTRKELDPDFKEMEVSTDKWDEEAPEDYPPAVEDYPPVVEAEVGTGSLVEVESPHVWSLYRTEKPTVPGTDTSPDDMMDMASKKGGQSKIDPDEVKAMYSWHCKHQAKLDKGRFKAVEVNGDTGTADPFWNEVVVVQVRGVGGALLRKLKRFSGGATSMLVVLNEGEECHTLTD